VRGAARVKGGGGGWLGAAWGQEKEQRGARHSGRQRRAVGKGPRPSSVGGGTVARQGRARGVVDTARAADKRDRVASSPVGSGWVRKEEEEARQQWRRALTGRAGSTMPLVRF
jgi:hypothetical protein